MKPKTGSYSLSNNKRAFEDVSTKIKKWIIQGVVKPGDKLPSETQLARQFNVGRQTVREALRLLELSGFLTVHQGAHGGSVVTNTILETLCQSFLDAVQMKNISVAEVIAARNEIDKMVLIQAIRNATEEDISLLNENIRKAEQKLSQNILAFEKTMKTLDSASSFFWLLVSLVTLRESYRLGIGSVHNPGTGFLSFWAAAILGILSLVLLLMALLKKEASTRTPSFCRNGMEKGPVCSGCSDDLCSSDARTRIPHQHIHANAPTLLGFRKEEIRRGVPFRVPHHVRHLSRLFQMAQLSIPGRSVRVIGKQYGHAA